MKNKRLNTNAIFCIVAFLLLTISYAFNTFKITDNNYRFFDRGDESNVISRLLMSRQQGLLSQGGLTGAYLHYQYDLAANDESPYILSLLPDGDITRFAEIDLHAITAQRYDDFITDRVTFGGEWQPYKSQPGGQAFMYAVIDKVLPINSEVKLQLFRLITVMLSALMFVLFTKWVFNNYGFTVALTVFLLIFISPWFFRFAYNLWWALWSYYIPFVVMLFVLDKKIKKENFTLDLKFYGILCLAIFVKFIFTGAEFISSTLIMAVCPLIYYLLVTKEFLKSGITHFSKAVAACIFGVLLGMGLLVIQIYILEGTWGAGIDHILYSFVKRSAYSETEGFSVLSILKMYFGGNAFYHEKLPWLQVSFGMLVLIISILSLMIFLVSRKLNLNYQKNKALVLTTLISISGPLSWFVIFTEHAYGHFMIDYIVWYMPYLLYGYVVVGVSIGLIVDKIKLKRQQRQISIK